MPKFESAEAEARQTAQDEAKANGIMHQFTDEPKRAVADRLTPAIRAQSHRHALAESKPGEWGRPVWRIVPVATNQATSSAEATRAHQKVVPNLVPNSVPNCPLERWVVPALQKRKLDQ